MLQVFVLDRLKKSSTPAFVGWELTSVCKFLGTAGSPVATACVRLTDGAIHLHMARMNTITSPQLFCACVPCPQCCGCFCAVVKVHGDAQHQPNRFILPCGLGTFSYGRLDSWFLFEPCTVVNHNILFESCLRPWLIQQVQLVKFQAAGRHIYFAAIVRAVSKEYKALKGALGRDPRTYFAL